MRKLIIICFLVFLSTQAMAQYRQLSGKVQDASGNPVIGATVKVVNGTAAAVTNTEGNFVLLAPENVTGLEVISIGFASQTVPVSAAQNSFVVNLAEQDEAMSDVVVTALGITRESKTLTYSTQQIDGDELSNVKNVNPINSLNGKVAGLQINRTSGGAGGSVRVVLRGDRSIRNSQPLYVIDGIPISNPTGGPDAGIYNGSPDGGDVLSTINPEDIESMSFLKGASASALYGSQGGNGVIIITTKKGKGGASKIDFSSSLTFDKVNWLPELQYKYGQTTKPTATEEGSEDSWGSELSSPSPDHVTPFFQTGRTWINSLSFTTGTEKANNYMSYSNTSNEGILPNSGFGQHTLTFRQSSKFLNDKLLFDGTFIGTIQNFSNRLTPGVYSNPLTGLYLFPRGLNFDEFKNYEYFSTARYLMAQNWWNINLDKGFVGQDYQQNPYWVMYRNTTEYKKRNYYGAISLTYLLNSWLRVQARGNVQNYMTTNESNTYATTQVTRSSPNGGFGTSKVEDLNLYGDLILLGDKNLSENFHLTFTLGSSILDQTSSGMGTGGRPAWPNVFTPGAIDILNYPNAVSLWGSGYRRQLQSVFASAELGFKDAIFLSVSDRNDWSSTLAFTPSMKKGYNYPSFGLNTIITELVKMPGFVSFGKVRGSYAEVGNDLPAFSTNPIYSASGGIATPPGSYPIRVAGYYLQPERVKNLEFGTEWRFFNNKLSLDFTWYKSNAINQHFGGIQVAPGLGAGGNADINGGNIENKGIELVASYKVFSGEPFSWNTTLNFSRNRNKIVELFNEDIIANPSPDILFGLGGGGGHAFLKQGGSFGDLYGRVFKRDAQGNIIVNATTGVPLFEADKFLGNANPKFVLGWNNAITFKKILVNFLIDGRFGGEVFSITQGYLDQMGVSKRSADARDEGGITIPNAVDEDGKPFTQKVDAAAYYRGIGGKTPIAEAYMFDATVIRFRELSISYQVPLKISGVSNIRVGVVGNNLFYFKKSAPFDPEQVSSNNPGTVGIDAFGSPATRSIGFSLRCTF